MVGLILFGILGASLLGSIIIDNFDDDEEAEPVEETGQILAYDGSGVITGTQGDDTLPAGQDPELVPSQVDLLGGDDTAVVESPFGIVVSGGDGDDVLSSTSVGNTLEGGAGDDTLTGIDANNMFGGSGDDVITFDSDVEYNSTVANIDGGQGDDTINVFADAGIDNPDRGGAIITGGEGSDDFNVTLDLMASDVELIDSDGLIESMIMSLRDFDPDEDMLSIEILRNDETEDREVEEIDFDQTEQDGVFTTRLSLYFEETDTALRAVAHMAIVSSSAFTVDNIFFVNA